MSVPDLDRLQLSLETMLAGVDPKARRRLAQAMARRVKTANAARIRANVTPEGDAMVPRKRRIARPNRLGRPEPLAPEKKGRMFRKAATPRWLRVRADAGGAEIGYSGVGARILRVHQDGGREQVGPQPDAPFANYPARPLIGLSPTDREQLLEMVAIALGG
ncbi:MAG: phage virion morphogenesis protein [Sphingomonas sp.]|nr:phage virion morphogenesis protein [Sphingomonas sp.]